MSTESELEAKYHAAVQLFKAAEQAEATAKKERDEKWALLGETQEGTKEYYIALAECWNAEVALIEIVEQRYAAEFKRDLCCTDCIQYKYGTDSKEGQIAEYRAELSRTVEFVYSDSSPYWTQWGKLSTKAECVWYQLKAEGYDNITGTLERAKYVFLDRMKNESNGEAFRNARNAAVVALNKWEQEDDRATWDKAQRRYSAELAKWNEFIPKGDQYAEELEEKTNLCIKGFAPISDLFCEHIGKSIAELQEQAKQDPHSAKDLELLKKYDAAAKICQAAEQAEAAAEKERDEKRALAKKTQRGTKEYYLAWTEKHKAEMVFIEKGEQRYAAEYKRDLCYTQWMKHKHGADSKEARIAQHRAELSCTKEFVYIDDSPYWTKWGKLYHNVWWVWNQLKAEGYENVAAELERQVELFCNRIKANGEPLCKARNAAFAALNRWEKENDRAAWDKAKPKYYAEWETWNAFKPKGEQYAETLHDEICKCVNNSLTVYAIVNKCEISALKDELGRKSKTFDALENELGEKSQEIDALRNALYQRGHEIGSLKDELLGRISALEATVGEMHTRIQSLIHMNQSSINSQ
ncbi:uncharacterized protein TM35_000084260 [Trypanosoma theileri]|uniref:Uncharacterized protein n=1 Tax=Trypanosoma theileri TaxID=67003 RepID=A0A1X0P1B8_9TRYP|nr:uncharacterized protein TM35_000084260 [Trypanosoma theileri]ORC90628.1 hypothetical protein TM35_000084260 [Trypanosoma theileri]